MATFGAPNVTTLKPPGYALVYETSTSNYWFDDGIFYLISKENKDKNSQVVEKEAEELKKRIGSVPICAIMDVSKSTPSTVEERRKSAEEIPLYFKAIAFIISNPVTRMLTHLYLGNAGIKIPVKMFSNEKDGYEWLKKYK